MGLTPFYRDENQTFKKQDHYNQRTWELFFETFKTIQFSMCLICTATHKLKPDWYNSFITYLTFAIKCENGLTAMTSNIFVKDYNQLDEHISFYCIITGHQDQVQAT